MFLGITDEKNFVELAEAATPIGSYFAPAPYIRESACERVWGANGVVVARPVPLSERRFSEAVASSDSALVDRDVLRYVLLLSARMTRVHSVAVRVDYRLSASPQDKLRASVSPLILREGEAGQSFVEGLALSAGVSKPRLRSDQAWVGGKSPLDASLALPDASYIPEQLKDFVAFVCKHQASSCREIAEAMAFQLLSIHPLADGNGRAARALLIKLASRSGSSYPLYFAWRLMFDKHRTAANWAALAVTGKPFPNSSHFDSWLAAAITLRDACERAAAAGLDARVIGALLLYGKVTDETIACSNQGCSAALTQKMIARLSALEFQVALEILEREVAKVVESFKSAVTK